MDKEYLLSLTINTSDPRHNKEFLWLSYNLNNLLSGKYDRIFWMTLEKRCLLVFADNGYDLQTGVWYCLIASQLYNWEGLANASWKFADTIAKNKKCWPPSTATQQRQQIIRWYVRNVIPVISFLPEEQLNSSCLRKLQNSFLLLSENNEFCYPGNFLNVKALLSEIKERKNNEDSLSKKEATLSSVNSSKSINLTLGIKKLNILSKKILFYFCLFFMLFNFILSYIKEPGNAWWLKQNYPDSALSKIAMKYAGCSGPFIKSTDKSILIYEKIDSLENKLNITEQKKEYITISELKTVVFDIKKILLIDEKSIDSMMNYIFSGGSGNVNEKEIELLINSIEYKLNEFNCNLGEFRARMDV